MRLPAVVLVALALAPAGGASMAAHPCRARLPRGPALPAALVMTTSCGSFAVGADGTVTRLPRHRPARHSGGTGRRYEATVQIRRNRAGRYFLLRRGHVVWRSRGLYPNDGGSISFGPSSFAFASYRRGVFLTDLRHGERLVVRGRGLYPYDFTRNGDLIVTGNRTIVLVARDGRHVGRFPYRVRDAFAFDPREDSLYFVTPRGRLAVLHDRGVGLLRPVGRSGTIYAPAPHLLVFAGAGSLVVTDRRGDPIAHARWPRGSSSDSGASVAPDGGTVAFRVSDARTGSKSGTATVYLLRRGASHALAVYRERLGPSGCAVGANLSWHGRGLLYSSSDGDRAVIDTQTGRVVGLDRLAARLPRRNPSEHASVAWASD